MEIEFQVHISPKEKFQQLVIAALLSCAMGGSFLLTILLYKPLAVPAAALTSFCLFRTWVPYFSLRQQFSHPDRLQLTDTHLIYFSHNQKTLDIPLRSIQSTGYKNGLLLWTHNYTFVNPQFPRARFLKRARSHGSDLFFEFFEPSVQARLQDVVQMEKPHDPRVFHHR